MEFQRRTDREFLNTFLGIMSSRKNNTYKFALARFLLEYSRRHDDLQVRYSKIAQYFMRCYWMQECRYGLRQGPANQTPEVISIIRKEFDRSHYPQAWTKIRQKEPQKIQRCVAQITKKCFDDVIPRFQHVRNSAGRAEESRIFYDYLALDYHDSADNKKIDPRGGIRLNPAAISFFKENYVLLEMVVVLEWLRFLEGLNVGMPKLSSKIDGRPIGTRNQGTFKKYLEPHEKECFYCRTPLADVEIHVEHVIPFDYIGETEMWNLVLACRRCNCSKLGNLPPLTYIKKLISRNMQGRDTITRLEKSLSLLGDDFARDIKRHYENAQQHGYVVLNDFPVTG